jgi:hypothetical protein
MPRPHRTRAHQLKRQPQRLTVDLAAVHGAISRVDTDHHRRRIRRRSIRTSRPDCTPQYRQVRLHCKVKDALGAVWLRMAVAAQAGLSHSPECADVLSDKLKTARFYFQRLLPEVRLCHNACAAGARSLIVNSENEL